MFPNGKPRAILAILLGVFILIMPSVLIYVIGLGLILYGINELFPNLRNQIREYLRGAGT